MILSLGLRKCGRASLVVILAVGLLAVVASESMAAVPYRSYIYDYWSEAVVTPNAYVPRMLVTGKDLGLGSFSSPSDLCVGANGDIYLVDTGNNRIVILDSGFAVAGIIDAFDNQGTADRFKGPRGIYVTGEGRVYVADTGNARIVELTSEGELVRVIGAPDVQDTGIVDEDFRYVPSKVAVDPIGRMYVLVEDEYDGLLAYTASGDFVGFVGAPRVTPSVADLFWQSISTREQRERSSLFLPTEYTNFDVDHKGLVLAVEANKIRRLNPSGQDVLSRSALNALIGKGYVAPQGDLRFPGRWDQGGQLADRATYTDRSSFTDIVSGPFGTYSALDGNRGRVFTYDEAGRLLYVFGGPGQQAGLLVNPVAIEVLDDLVLVLDRNTQAITVYEPTLYGSAILRAVGYYQTGRYDESMHMWETVLKFNTNYAMAYQGIGDALLRKGQYVDALHYYRLGDDRIGYSEAFSYARKDAVNRWFGPVVTVAIVLVLLASLVRRAWRSGSTEESSPSKSTPASGPRAYMLEIGRSLRFALHVIVSPLDGFWDLKHERRGSAAAATVILILVTATYIFLRQYTGFVFNSRDISAINIYTEAASVLLPFGLWCVVNWSLTTLMDGKGGIRDIYIATAYALVPLVIVYVPLTILSHFMTIEEGSLYSLMLVLALIWSGLLLVVGNSVTHDYSTVAGVWTSALTVAGMGLVLFISLLFFGLTNQLASFFTDLYTELMFRF